MNYEELQKEIYKNEKLIPEASEWFLVELIEHEGGDSGLTYVQIRDSLWDKVGKLFKSKENFDFTFNGFTTSSLLKQLLYQEILTTTTSSEEKYHLTGFGKKLLEQKKPLIREYIGEIKEI